MTQNPFDYSNDKPDIREPIPAGTLLYLRMTYTPGGADLPGTPAELKEGALTKAKDPSDAYYLKTEYTVLRGPYKGRKFWGNLTVAGGKVDEKGKSIAAGITRQTIRAILDSSQGLKTSDESPEAMAKRVIRGYRDLQGRQFVAKAKIEPAQAGYAAKNGLGQVMTIDMKGYPMTEAELDNPAVGAGAVAKDAPPAPTWGATPATAVPVTAPTPAVVAQPQTVGFVAPAAETAAPAVQTAAALATDSAIPLWAQPSQKAA
jgi:hypothetical protein